MASKVPGQAKLSCLKIAFVYVAGREGPDLTSEISWRPLSALVSVGGSPNLGLKCKMPNAYKAAVLLNVLSNLL